MNRYQGAVEKLSALANSEMFVSLFNRNSLALVGYVAEDTPAKLNELAYCQGV
jgi:hypothetical protein